MSIRAKTAYLVECDYPGCGGFYDFWSPTLHALNRFYEDMSTPQPLPKLECEDTILDILQNEN